MPVKIITAADHFGQATTDHETALQSARNLAKTSRTDAIAAFEKAITAIESNATLKEVMATQRRDALFSLAELYCDEGNTDMEGKTYNRAVAVDQKNLGAWNRYGAYFERERQWDKALVCYERSTAIDARTTGLVGKANALFLLGRTNDALTTVRPLVQKSMDKLHDPAIRKAVLLFLAADSSHEQDRQIKATLLKKLGPRDLGNLERMAHVIDTDVQRRVRQQMGNQAAYAGHFQFGNGR